ncbi:hypothetical protein L1987_26864 [Smallanthus sonchifolius]|uniref:Uncharacterized protein n=1 Tax=Smallanthus sonchifolius TaxID=185202 RepID=A0ACB9IA62_9ASTR|nr:hypothetical protein L1987_26864 [Smallanthus sonchifolius]
MGSQSGLCSNLHIVKIDLRKNALKQDTFPRLNYIIIGIQLVLDSHRWVPQPAVGFSSNSFGEESQEDVTPPPNLMEYPHIAVFINGVSAAMNELRPCAPISLKHKLAQELVKGLQTVFDSLLRYNTSRVLRENEYVLFLSLCRAFIEVAKAQLAHLGHAWSPTVISSISNI